MGPNSPIFLSGARKLMPTSFLFDGFDTAPVTILLAHEGTVYTLALSADGKRLVSGSLDGTARLWDMIAQ